MHLPLKLNLSLLNLLREFSSSGTSYSPEFLKGLRQQLANSKSKIPSDTAKFVKEGLSIDIEYLLLAGHIGFAKIANLQDFVALLQPSFKLSPLNVNDINKTNIFTKTSLYFAVSSVKLDEADALPEAHFLEELSVELLMDESEQIPGFTKETIYIPISLVKISLSSFGQIDIHFYCYLCHCLNKAFADKELALYPWIFPDAKLVPDFSDQGIANIKSNSNLKFSPKEFENYVRIVSENPLDLGPLKELLPELETLVYYSVHFQNREINLNLEKLFIALLGHSHVEVRNRAVLFLNILYDKTHWQLRGALKTKVATVGDPFKIESLVEAEGDDSHFAVMLNTYPFSQNGLDEVLSWHIPKVIPHESKDGENSSALVISIDFGSFTRTGFYDWKLVKFQKGGKIASVYTGFQHAGSLSTSIHKLETLERGAGFTPKTKPIQGRIIVHPKNTLDLQLHEIAADFPEGLPTEKYRGNFTRIAESIPNYARSGINGLYIMGALERDYNLQYGDDSKGKSNIIPKRKEASPLAITNRSMPSTALGAEKGLKQLVEAAKQKDVKIILDFVARISSSRHHKKYDQYILHCLDSQGKKVPLYGSDGRGWAYEDTQILNFRKKETWDLIIQETVDFIKKYNIDGIMIDNSDIVPQYFDINVEELSRRETDGESTYSKEDMFYGNIVTPTVESGYWASDYQQTHANPFYVRLCKVIWQHFPNFLIIGDVIGGHNLEDREENLIRSGPIPRVYKFPPALASIYGQHLHRDGTINGTEKQTVNSLRSWYEGIRKHLPSGSIVIQSTTSHAFPYPSLLFKRGTWSVIDLFFFLPDIPMTFIGEEDGHAYRIKTVNVFRKEGVNKGSPTIKRKMMSKSATDLKKALFDAIEEIPVRENLIESHSVSERASLEEIQQGDTQISRETGPEYGFDLKKIRLHYEHRRKLRHDNAVLREGKLIPLLAEHADGFHTGVLSFARIRRREGAEMAIVAINFNPHNVYFYINLKNLRYMLDEIDENLDRAVVKIEDWVGTTVNDYYTIYEFLHGRIETSLKPQGSLVWGANIYFNDETLYQKTILCSVGRIQACIMKGQSIKGNEISSLLYHSVRDLVKLSDFLNNFGYILKNFLIPNKINPAKTFNLIEDFKKDSSLSGKLYAFCEAFIEENAKLKDKEIEQDQKTIMENIKGILDYNRLGSIVFVCPELGRWSTQGGLGVMVDELSQGFVLLGEDVICVSPYYERNRKGESNYLLNDPDNIKWVFNVDVFLDGKYTVGVHHGVVKGVKQYFLHNPYAFPSAYADGDARYTMQQLSIIAKATMEVLCYIKNIPSVIVTNDWFTGLVPAYVKNGHFGDTFKGTKFFHIVHNLEPTYEGRMWPQPHDGTLEFIHKLPSYLFVDPYWKDIVLNPSRCALLSCDQWGTVSNSYKEDLLRESPLNGILGNHQMPFGFPNGIPKDARLERLIKVCNNDHTSAKAALQKKYFSFQKLEDDVALFGFVGRITQQKGVHLILDAAEHLINKFQGKIQFIVGGPANYKDPYGSYCAGMMTDIARRYPYNFWAAPGEFFTDGTLVNSGCDFGLMPSLFEPGGIVQHEFFIGGTPVIAFKTGGLKDTVKEYDPKLKKGNGFCFEDHKVGDLIYAIERAMNIYTSKEDMKTLRKNAFESAIDVSEVSRAWLKEMYRISGKSFIDPDMIKGHKKNIVRDWDPEKYKEALTIRRLEQEAQDEQARLKGLKYQALYMKARGDARKVTFNYQTTQLPRPKSVAVVGNFDEWKAIYPMHFDPLLNKWNLTLNLQPGEYYYKFVVDDKWICSDDDPKINDIEGNINNYLIVNK